MAYQEDYGPRSNSTHVGPTNNAPHFPHSHSQSLSLSLSQSQSPSIQQQSHFYPNQYQYPPQSNQFNASSSPPTSSPYTIPQPSEAQTYQTQRQPYPPNHIQNGAVPLMQRPMTLPDDHFKKPYLPQQQYINHGRFLFPLLFPSSMFWDKARLFNTILADTVTWYIP